MLKESNKYKSSCIDDTLKIANDFSKTLRTGNVITLSGNLGVGKTVFAKGLISSLSTYKVDEIISPTFNICQSYKSIKGLEIWHYDLYRLDSLGELIETGIEDTIDSSITIIEWPEIAQEIIPNKRVDVLTSFISDFSNDARLIEINDSR